jgi:hypothetical protein
VDDNKEAVGGVGQEKAGFICIVLNDARLKRYMGYIAPAISEILNRETNLAI